jgi:hypothetical protein
MTEMTSVSDGAQPLMLRLTWWGAVALIVLQLASWPRIWDLAA